MRKGFVGQVISIISLVIWAAVFIALLKRFDWDVIALVTWVFNFVIGLVLRLADWIAGTSFFQQVVG